MTMAETSTTGWPIPFPGFEGRGLSLRPAGLWQGATIMCDGAPVPRKDGGFEAKNNQGQPVSFKLGRGIDPIPKILAGDQSITLAPPLAWYAYVWVALPIALVVIGGLIGGVTGAVAAYLNFQVMRGQQPAGTRYLLTGLITVAAVVVFLVLAVIFTLLIHGGQPG
jgi:hypothetical protein